MTESKKPFVGCNWRKMLGRLLTLTCICGLTACATTTGSSGPSLAEEKVSFCAVAEPFFWASADTDATIVQAKKHNAVGKALRCASFTPARQDK